MTTLHLRKSVGRSPLRHGLPHVERIWIIRGFLFIPLVLACFGFAPGVQAATEGDLGKGNTANGWKALVSNVSGIGNTAYGSGALLSNTTGGANTANGTLALSKNTSGNGNIAFGANAGVKLTTGSNNIDIDNNGVTGESGTIRIGTVGTQTATFVAGIRGQTTANANAIPVLIDSAGQLGTTSSSRRFKKEIKAMDKTSGTGEGLHRTLRSSERDVAERVPQRTSQSRATGSDHHTAKAGLSVQARGAAEANQSAHYGPPESERPA